MNITINFAIVGCGVISKFHIGAINAIEDARLIGVYDSVFEFAKKTAAECGTKAYATYEELLADEAVDAVCICTPSGLHASLATQAVQAKKHVLIEKPIALTLTDSDRISQSARLNHVKVGVVSQLRFSPAIKHVKKALDDGILGRIVCADLYMKYYRSQHYYDTNQWRGTITMDGGGALMNQGIHGIDLLRYIMGPLKSITALSGTLVRDIEVEDTLSAIVEYKNGAFGVIQATTSVYPGFPRRIEINGEYGCIILEEDRIAKWEIEGSPSYEYYEDKEKKVFSHSDPTLLDQNGHIEQMKNFISAIRGDTELLVDDIQGRNTLEIVLKAYESAQNKRTINFI